MEGDFIRIEEEEEKNGEREEEGGEEERRKKKKRREEFTREEEREEKKLKSLLFGSEKEGAFQLSKPRRDGKEDEREFYSVKELVHSSIHSSSLPPHSQPPQNKLQPVWKDEDEVEGEETSFRREDEGEEGREDEGEEGREGREGREGGEGREEKENESGESGGVKEEENSESEERRERKEREGWNKDKEREEKLRSKFEKVSGGKPRWADETKLYSKTLEEREEGEEEEGWFNKTTRKLTSSTPKGGGGRGGGGGVGSGKLELRRVSRKFGLKNKTKKAVHSIRFHPSSPILLASQGNSFQLYKLSLPSLLHSSSFSSSHAPPFKENVSSSSSHAFAFLSSHKCSNKLERVEYSWSGREVVGGFSNSPQLLFFDLLSQKSSEVSRVRGMEETLSYSSFLLAPGGESVVVVDKSFGYLYFLSLKTYKCEFKLKAKGALTCASFASSSPHSLFASSAEGEMYEFDLRERKCKQVVKDEGALSTCSLSLSPDSLFLATGSKTGVVNLYETEKIRETSLFEEATPYKSLFNLTTPVNLLSFNHDSQLLSLSSSLHPNSLRFVHVPSGKVFGDFLSHNKDLLCNPPLPPSFLLGMKRAPLELFV